MAPRKRHALNLLLIDANSSANESALSNPNSSTDFDVAVSIADAILCREVGNFSPKMRCHCHFQIFAQSKDEVCVVFFGLDGGVSHMTAGGDGFAPADFNIVEHLEAIKPGAVCSLTGKAPPPSSPSAYRRQSPPCSTRGAGRGDRRGEQEARGGRGGELREHKHFL